MLGSDGRLLGRILLVDAATCAAMGVALLAGAGLVDDLLGLGATFLRLAGAALLPFAALLLWTARQAPPPARVVHAIAAGNLLWVAASVALAIGARETLTTLGTAVVLAQAAAVLVLAELELTGARRLRRGTRVVSAAG